MKIILTSVGTRGDIEPFLAIGKMLKDKGHQVICAFPECFRALTEQCDIEFASLGSKNNDMLESDIGRTIMGGESQVQRFFAYIKLARDGKAANEEKESRLYDLIQQEEPDRILYHSKNIYPLLWECDNRGKTIFICPFPYFHYVKRHPFLTFRRNFGEYLNRLTFKIYDFGVVTSTMMINKSLHINDNITREQLKEIIPRRKFVYTISPSLFPRPSDWDSHVKVLGHQELKGNSDWQPEKSLTDFIEKYEKIVFVTFGSMITPHPQQKTKIILDVLERHNIPAIINTADGGLMKPEPFNSESIYFVSHIPYDWILPKMYAVIHHGGAGTTHLAIKYGCATMIIPHFMDQFLWDDMICELGVGPKGVKVSRMTTKNLEPKVLELLNTRRFKEKSVQIGHHMKQEDFTDELYTTIIHN
jgi:UDP:flavonoid glycosyltransferase YjiC (YdhE family)